MLPYKNFPILRPLIFLCGGLAILSGLHCVSQQKSAKVPSLFCMAGAGVTGPPLRRRRKAGNRTPARDAEEEIAAALQQGRIFRQISDTLPDLLYIYDLTEQRNIYVNREIGAVLGYTPEEIRAIGSGLFVRLIHPDDLAGVAEQTEKLYTLKDGEAQETEYRMQHKDGAWRWLRSRDSIFGRKREGHADVRHCARHHGAQNRRGSDPVAGGPPAPHDRRRYAGVLRGGQRRRRRALL